MAEAVIILFQQDFAKNSIKFGLQIWKADF